MGVAVLRLLAIGYTGEPRTLQLRPEEPIPVLDHAHFETPVWKGRRSAAARDAGGMRHHGDLLSRAVLLVAFGAGGVRPVLRPAGALRRSYRRRYVGARFRRAH